jgi:hypothetical protein
MSFVVKYFYLQEEYMAAIAPAGERSALSEGLDPIAGVRGYAPQGVSEIHVNFPHGEGERLSIGRLETGNVEIRQGKGFHLGTRPLENWNLDREELTVPFCNPFLKLPAPQRVKLRQQMEQLVRPSESSACLWQDTEGNERIIQKKLPSNYFSGERNLVSVTTGWQFPVTHPDQFLKRQDYYPPTYKVIALEQIFPSSFSYLNETRVQELKKLILRMGLNLALPNPAEGKPNDPIAVYPIGDGSRYVLANGNHRVCVLARLGVRFVPCLVYERDNDDHCQPCTEENMNYWGATFLAQPNSEAHQMPRCILL